MSTSSTSPISLDSGLRVVNKRIAVEPFPTRSVDVKVKSGFGTVVQKTELVPLKVVFATEASDRQTPAASALTLLEGDTVYVRGEAVAHQWAAEVYDLEGKKFIFLPEDFVCMVSRRKGS